MSLDLTRNVLTRSQMQALDRYAIDAIGLSSEVLMENAGRALSKLISTLEAPIRRKKISIVCGPGNNGGDGCVVARHLHSLGALVHVWLVGFKEFKTAESRNQFHILQKMLIPCSQVESPQALAAQELRTLNSSEIFVDAMFGIGLKNNMEPPYSQWIEKLNQLRKKKKKMYSVDIPSGLNADTGETMGHAVQADATMTFGCKKRGFYVGEGPVHAGRVFCDAISMEGSWLKEIGASQVRETSLRDFKPWVPKKSIASHKNNYGHVLVIAGSPQKSGAAVLTSMSCLRAGAGLVTLATPASAHTIVKRQLVEVMTEPLPDSNGELSLTSLASLRKCLSSATVCVVGPGLLPCAGLRELLLTLIEEFSIPWVMDADALNVLSQDLQKFNERQPRDIVLTPHPGEMSRIFNTSTPEIQKDRFGFAERLASSARATVLLKGAYTLIATPGGETWVNPTGSTLLAAAGMGDVLSGVIGGLIAQGVKSHHAAILGAYVHGRAGDSFANVARRGILASEVMGRIPYVLHHCLRERTA